MALDVLATDGGEGEVKTKRVSTRRLDLSTWQMAWDRCGRVVGPRLCAWQDVPFAGMPWQLPLWVR